MCILNSLVFVSNDLSKPQFYIRYIITYLIIYTYTTQNQKLNFHILSNKVHEHNQLDFLLRSQASDSLLFLKCCFITFCLLILFPPAMAVIITFLHALVLVFVSACMFRLGQAGGVPLLSAIVREAQIRT